MAITTEQVADLLAGDVVRVTGFPNSAGAAIEGPLVNSGGALYVGEILVKEADGDPSPDANLILSIVSKTERPVYTNHLRTEAVTGDVVQPVDSADARQWMCIVGLRFVGLDGRASSIKELPDLTLLIDGETGNVVP
jgi:hypothetical protein